MTFKRADRVADRIREEVSKILQNKVKDPRIGFVTVVSVDVSTDLKNAKIFFSVMGTDPEVTLKGLERARPFIRRELAHRLNLRYAPEISLHIDHSAEEAERIIRLIDEVNKKDG